MYKQFLISKGRMAVYSPEHELQEQRLYYTSDGMKKIMSNWMKEYPEGFYISVRPYEDPPKEKRVYKLPVCHDAVITDEVKEKLVRPPAVYNNIKFQY